FAKSEAYVCQRGLRGARDQGRSVCGGPARRPTISTEMLARDRKARGLRDAELRMNSQRHAWGTRGKHMLPSRTSGKDMLPARTIVGGCVLQMEGNTVSPVTNICFRFGKDMGEVTREQIVTSAKVSPNAEESLATGEVSLATLTAP